MKLKDSSIICMMILTWIFIAMGVLGTESEISKIEMQVAALCSTEKTDISRIYSVMEWRNSEVDARLDKIEEVNTIQNTRLIIHRDRLNDIESMFDDLLAQQEHLEEYCRSLPDNALGIEVSDQDIRDIAALVYLEAGSQSYTCQKAIASVIFNRMIRYNMTAHQVIYQPGVFSPSGRVHSTTPNTSCVMAVREVLEDGCILPPRVTAFRNGHYHNFGTKYTCIDGVYFTLV